MSARKTPARLNSEQLYSRLKLRSFASEKKLLEKHPTAAKFFESTGLRPGQIREHAAKLLTTGALAGTLLLSAHSAVAPQQPQSQTAAITGVSTQKDFAQSLRLLLPPIGQWQLTPDEEKKISKLIQGAYGVNALPELEGNRLNNDYGRMGAEQHLPRFPGDSIFEHKFYSDKGITPGLGGWGYFAPSREQMTPELYETEKYYVAVQTLYLPDWNKRTKYLFDWYKYRRVVVVNPANGKAIVAAVADAGPADWTGKHFGGSPEVMAYLGINVGMQNSPVVLFFLDDPGKRVPLGPLLYNGEGKLIANR